MRIFLTGATGYLGGSLAVTLLEAGHHVRGLTRTPATVVALRELGVDPVVGNLDDSAVLAEEARAADAVINAADSDHPGTVTALVAALADSGKPLLHTSGSSIVGQATNGEAQDDIYTEADVDPAGSWQPAADKAPRVAIDREVLAAADRGVRSVVLCNTMIYGTGLGLRADSVQIPRLVATARRTKVVRHIGPGKNIWSDVHLVDACDLYLRALEGAVPGSFYFVENGEASFLQISESIAAALRLAAPQPIDIESAIAEWGYEPAVYALGSNSRVRGVRPRTELDWRPRQPAVNDWIASSLTVGL